eukprot:g6388.t1
MADEDTTHWCVTDDGQVVMIDLASKAPGAAGPGSGSTYQSMAEDGQQSLTVHNIKDDDILPLAQALAKFQGIFQEEQEADELVPVQDGRRRGIGSYLKRKLTTVEAALNGRQILAAIAADTAPGGRAEAQTLLLGYDDMVGDSQKVLARDGDGKATKTVGSVNQARRKMLNELCYYDLSEMIRKWVDLETAEWKYKVPGAPGALGQDR